MPDLGVPAREIQDAGRPQTRAITPTIDRY
jgi:hypothetical protein